ncbi:MAG TPA: hypothetical protein VD766_10320, partial [Solirubrobacterales bacterium]|nr:hypothetical protein [Solirubrobacterales bacterium]
ANLGTDSVQADEIRYWSIGSEELALSSVGDAHLKTDSVRPDEIQADAVGSSEIAPDAVGGLELAPNAVGSSEIADNTVGSNELIHPLVVEGPTVRVGPDANFRTDTAYASCPAGYQLLGGGGVRDKRTQLGITTVLEDRPVGDSWAWGISVPADSNETYTIQAYALCLLP